MSDFEAPVPPGGEKRTEKPPLETIINSYDFESIAERTVSPKTWAFYSSAATDLLSMRLNKKAFDKVLFRPRVMRNVERVDTRTRVLGFETGLPFFVAPTAMQGMINPGGEKAVTKGVGEEKVIHIISTNSSYPIAEIISSGRGPQNQTHFLQLYVNANRTKTATLLSTAKSCGIKAIFVTVDSHTTGKREADERLNIDSPVKSTNTDVGVVLCNDKKGGGIGRLTGSYIDRRLSWEDIPWIKSVAGGLPIVLKGIQTAADAKLAAEHGVQGIVVSNHGGRSLDTSPPPLYTLLEIHKIYPEVFDALEVYLDGGIRRGTDIFKALCLGATAVGIGRPYLYALNYGQEGVAHLTQSTLILLLPFSRLPDQALTERTVLKDELETTMRMCGVTDLSQVRPSLVSTRSIDALVEDTLDHSYAKWRPKSRI